jgi:hypothetical protein
MVLPAMVGDIAYPQHFVGIRVIELGDSLLVTSQSCPDDTLHVHPIKLSFIVMMPYLTKRLHDQWKFLIIQGSTVLRVLVESVALSTQQTGLSCKVTYLSL